MSRIFDRPLDEVVRGRTSVRTYDGNPLTVEEQQRLEAFIRGISHPFMAEVSFRMLRVTAAENAKKLGTYGIIQGAVDYVGVMVKESDMAYEAAGYAMEELILYAASIGIGTCWLGGTYNKGEFAKAMDVPNGTLFPAVTPVGRGARRRMTEKLMRMTTKGDQRKPWDSLFFSKDLASPLSESEAGAYAFALEMVRLAPSASNKQPWRIVRDGDSFHFFEAKEEGYSDRLGFDIQRVDLGIAACHFHLAARECGMDGAFAWDAAPSVAAPKNVQYRFTWTEQSV